MKPVSTTTNLRDENKQYNSSDGKLKPVIRVSFRSLDSKPQRTYENCADSWFTMHIKLASLKGKGKGKAIPLQARTGPEGSRRMRIPDFKTVST